MADINVERKSSGSNILPWVLGLLLLAALIWGVMSFMDNDDDDVIVTEPTTTEVAPAVTTP